MTNSEQTFGKKKSCCKVDVNLERIQVQKDLWCSICRICGCKHWEAAADPLRIGLRFE